jgi:hypothetical protein
MSVQAVRSALGGELGRIVVITWGRGVGGRRQVDGWHTRPDHRLQVRVLA